MPGSLCFPGCSMLEHLLLYHNISQKSISNLAGLGGLHQHTLLPLKSPYSYQEDSHRPNCQYKQGETWKAPPIGHCYLESLGEGGSRKKLCNGCQGSR